MNSAGRGLLLAQKRGPSRKLLTCCDLVCRQIVRPRFDETPACLTQEALAAGGPLEEVQVNLPPDSPAELAWVTVSPLGGDAGAIFHVRADDSEATQSGEPPSRPAGCACSRSGGRASRAPPRVRSGASGSNSDPARCSST